MEVIEFDGPEFSQGNTTRHLAEGTSSHESRAPLLSLLSSLFKNGLERSLLVMVRDGPTNSLQLDLSAKNNLLVSKFNHIKALYDKDFPVTTVKQSNFVVLSAPQPGQPQGEVARAQIVREVTRIKDVDQYKLRIEEWNAEVNRHEDSELNNFVRGRVTCVVDSQEDTAVMRTKLEKVPVMRENKRKLFLYDDTNAHPLDWPKLKKQRKSMHTPHQITLHEEAMDPVIDAYTYFKTTDDQGSPSEDYLAVITQGPPANCPSQKNAELAHRKFQNIRPRLGKPCVGHFFNQASASSWRKTFSCQHVDVLRMQFAS